MPDCGPQLYSVIEPVVIFWKPKRMFWGRWFESKFEYAGRFGDSKSRVLW